MYVHKRCCPSNGQLDMERTVHGYCGCCGNQGTVYLVVGTEDAYRFKRQGVTYVVRNELNTTDADVTSIETPLEAELTEELDPAEKFAKEALEATIEASIPEEKEPEETVVEAEPDDVVAVVEGKVELVEEFIEQPLEAESGPFVVRDLDELAAALPEDMVLEAESEVTVVKGPLTPGSEEYEVKEAPSEALDPIPPDTVEEAKRRLRVQTKKAEEARKAKIEALEAELAELRSKAKQ